ncbi:MAG: hypothetical protein ACPLRA_04360, partial [Candidatus Saccharicenans sp.]
LGNEEELVISHRVFRSGESEYRLNGKAVRLKDIQDELWKNSIGEKEYFVIEQGAIGSFVTSKPQEKRMLIEEAAGTAYYKDKKKQAQSKLESSEQNLIRLEDIIIEVEKSKNSLYRQALAAARYRRLRERLRELTAHHFYRKMLQLDRALDEVQAKLKEAGAQEEQSLLRVKEEEKALSLKRKELWDLEKQLKDRQERAFSLKSQLSRLESEIERETKRSEYLETSRQKAEADRIELGQEIKALEEEKREIISRLSELESLLAQTTIQSEEKRVALEEARKLTAEEENFLGQLRKSQLEKIQEATEVRNNFYQLEKELELFLKQTEKLTQEKENYSGQKARIETRISELKYEVERSLEEKRKNEETLKALTEELGELNQELTKLEVRLSEITRSLEETGHQLRALEKISELEREAAESNLIPGALGWFSELVEIPEEEAYLFDLFWKEEARAQACWLETFKQSLPLEDKKIVLLLSERPGLKIPENLLRSEGVLGLLKQKIKTRPELQKPLESLQEAVIVKDILTAISLWEKYPDFNFITPAGDLLLSSGLLKAGQKKEGLFSLSQEKKKLQKQLEQLASEKEPLVNQIEEIAQTKAKLESAIQETKSRLQEIDHKISDSERESRFVNLELQKLITGLEIMEKEERIQREEQERLQQKKEAALAELQKIESALEEIREKISQKEEALRQLKEKEKTEEEKSYQLKSELNLLLEKINSTRSNLQSLEKRHQVVSHKLGLLEMDIYTGQEEKAKLARLAEELRQKAIILD